MLWLIKFQIRRGRKV